MTIRPTRERLAIGAPDPSVVPEHLADQKQAMNWFAAEHHVLIAAVGMAADTGCRIHAWQIPWAIAEFLDRAGHWHDLAATQRTALAAATRIGDVAAQAVASRLLATACFRLGEYDRAQACLRSSLQSYQQIGDQAGQARAHRLLANVAAFQGRFADALSDASQALILFRDIGDRPGEADALNSVGWCHAMLGAYQQADAFCLKALILHRAVGNRHGEAAAQDSLGYVTHRSGRHAAAIRHYVSALSLFREAGDRYHQADTLTHLGDAYHDARQPQRARETWVRALRLFTELSHPNASQLRTRILNSGDERASSSALTTSVTQSREPAETLLRPKAPHTPSWSSEAAGWSSAPSPGSPAPGAPSATTSVSRTPHHQGLLVQGHHHDPADCPPAAQNRTAARTQDALPRAA